MPHQIIIIPLRAGAHKGEDVTNQIKKRACKRG